MRSAPSWPGTTSRASLIRRRFGSPRRRWPTTCCRNWGWNEQTNRGTWQRTGIGELGTPDCEPVASDHGAPGARGRLLIAIGDVMVIVEPLVSEEKLRQLLDEQAESAALDY